MKIFEILIFILSYSFYFKIIMDSQNYIFRSFFFIKPMKKQYDIMIESINKDISSRFPYIFIASLLIISFFVIIYNLNILLFYFSLIIFLIYSIYLYKIFAQYTILNYINEFSDNLFDWHKIYTLSSINEKTKIACFNIHNIDYAGICHYRRYPVNEKNLLIDYSISLFWR